MKRVFQIAILILIAVTYVGCATTPRSTCIIPVPDVSVNKPESITYLQSGLEPDAAAACNVMGNTAVSQIDMHTILNDTALFEADEAAYLSEYISKTTTGWIRGSYVVIQTASTPVIKMTIADDQEWGNVLAFSYEIEESRGKQIGRQLMAEFTTYQSASTVIVERKYDLTGNKVCGKCIPIKVSRLAGAGYVYMGEEIDESTVSNIRDNQYTRENLKTTFGEPNEIRTLPDGSEVFVYYFQKFGKSKATAFIPLGGLVKNKIRHTQILELRMVDGVVIEHAYDVCKSDCESIL